MAGPANWRHIAWGLLLAIVVCVSGFWGLVAGQAADQRVFRGVSVQGMHLGGLTKAETLDRLCDIEEKLRNREVELSLNGHSWRVTLGQLGLVLDTDKMADEAMHAGRAGFFVHQWTERRRLGRDGLSLPLHASLDRARLKTVTEQLTGSMLQPPRDAGFRITGDDKVIISPGQDGRVVDTQRLYDLVINSLHWNNPHSIEIPISTVPPKHCTDDIKAMGLTGLLATYTSNFAPSLINRSYNVSVAAAALDNLLVAPNEVVSFNATVGPRDSTTGYREAPIIIDNQFEDGMGGGVCQVASTLYNAVLLANLEIVERSNHSLPVTYVPIGRDATVVYGAVDFKFRNNSGRYIFIRSAVNQGRLTFKIYGDTTRQKRVEVHSWIVETFEPEVVREDDPDLFEGEEVVKQKGLKGYKARGERWVWQQGGSVTKESLPPSHYRPLKRIIAVGTKPAPVTIIPEDDVHEPVSGEELPELISLPPCQ